MTRWLAIEAEARDACRRLELLPAAEADAMHLLGALTAGRRLMGEALR